MVQRIIWGSIFGVVLIGVFLIGQPLLFVALVTFIAMLCFREFFGLMSNLVPSLKNSLPFYQSYAVYSLAAVVLMWNLKAAHVIVDSFFWISVLMIYGVFFYELFFNKKEMNVINLAVYALAFLYIAVPLILVGNIAFEAHSYSPKKILGIFILIWTCDTMQYFSGKLLGKNKLYEKISPNKTIEGAIGGIIFTIVAGYIVSIFWKDFSTRQWMAIAAIVAVMGIVGDLVESLFKRQAGVKDSGNFMPGHGGALDRFDSFLFVIPFVAIFLMLMKYFF